MAQGSSELRPFPLSENETACDILARACRNNDHQTVNTFVGLSNIKDFINDTPKTQSQPQNIADNDEFVNEAGADKNETILSIACKYSSLAIVQRLIDAGAKLTASHSNDENDDFSENDSYYYDDDDWNPRVLHNACGSETESKKKVIFLLEKLARDNDVDMPALHYAAHRRHEKSINIILSDPTHDINVKDSQGHTLLHKIILGFYVYSETPYNLAKPFLVHPTFNINTVSDISSIVLCAAAHEGLADVVKTLTTLPSCDVNEWDGKCCTALHHAAENGHGECVRILTTDTRCDVNARDDIELTALHRAAENGHGECVRIFTADTRCDVNAKDVRELTALHRAAENGHGECVRILTADTRCDVNTKDVRELTALHRAAENGHHESVRILTADTRCDVNARDTFERTALHRAAANGHGECVRILTADTRCDVNARGVYERTALHRAAGNGHGECVRILTADTRCDVNARDEFGETALFGAAEAGRVECVKVLASHTGCDIHVKDHRGHRTARDVAVQQQLLSQTNLWYDKDEWQTKCYKWQEIVSILGGILGQAKQSTSEKEQTDLSGTNTQLDNADKMNVTILGAFGHIRHDSQLMGSAQLSTDKAARSHLVNNFPDLIRFSQNVQGQHSQAHQPHRTSVVDCPSTPGEILEVLRKVHPIANDGQQSAHQNDNESIQRTLPMSADSQTDTEMSSPATHIPTHRGKSLVGITPIRQNSSQAPVDLSSQTTYAYVTETNPGKLAFSAIHNNDVIDGKLTAFCTRAYDVTGSDTGKLAAFSIVPNNDTPETNSGKLNAFSDSTKNDVTETNNGKLTPFSTRTFRIADKKLPSSPSDNVVQPATQHNQQTSTIDHSNQISNMVVQPSSHATVTHSQNTAMDYSNHMIGTAFQLSNHTTVVHRQSDDVANQQSQNMDYRDQTNGTIPQPSNHFISNQHAGANTQRNAAVVNPTIDSAQKQQITPDVISCLVERIKVLEAQNETRCKTDEQLSNKLNTIEHNFRSSLNTTEENMSKRMTTIEQKLQKIDEDRRNSESQIKHRLSKIERIVEEFVTFHNVMHAFFHSPERPAFSKPMPVSPQINRPFQDIPDFREAKENQHEVQIPQTELSDNAKDQQPHRSPSRGFVPQLSTKMSQDSTQTQQLLSEAQNGTVPKTVKSTLAHLGNDTQLQKANQRFSPLTTDLAPLYDVTTSQANEILTPPRNMAIDEAITPNLSQSSLATPDVLHPAKADTTIEGKSPLRERNERPMQVNNIANTQAFHVKETNSTLKPLGQLLLVKPDDSSEVRHQRLYEIKRPRVCKPKPTTETLKNKPLKPRPIKPKQIKQEPTVKTYKPQHSFNRNTGESESANQKEVKPESTRVDGKPDSAKTEDGQSITMTMKRDPDMKNFSCDICSFTSNRKSSLKRHILLKHTDSMPFLPCTLCDKKYKFQKSLDDHRRVVHEQKPFECDICSKKYKTYSGLLTHTREHAGKFAYTCEHCGEKTNYKSDYDAHIASHSGQKTFACDGCNKRFSHSSNFSQHKRICPYKLLK